MKKSLLTLVAWSAALLVSTAAPATPNIVFIFVDDSGWGDFSCYGNPVVDKQGLPITPNIDALAAQGTRFTNGYVAAPICSPSRSGLLTGMHPSRHGIHSFLDNKAANANRSMDDWLQPQATTTARLLRDAGYATGLFGKWHMGGGRDVDNAPFPQEYGFETSLTSFEGMGDRLLVNGHGLSNQNADVPGDITWTEWYQLANLHTDAAINFITTQHAAGKPFFINVPYDDTHSPYNVEPGHEDDFDHITDDVTAKTFLGELNDLDKQIGRLVTAIDNLGIASNTLIIIVGDNGAPNDSLNTLLKRNGGLKGGKGNIWEGGMREAFIARMPGTVPAGIVNTTTAISTLDMLPTYCSLANIPLPAAPFAGEDMKDVLLGSARPRVKPLFWEFGTVSGDSPASPKLATRVGDWKFLRNPDGSNRHLYDLANDPGETINLVTESAYTATVAELESGLVKWYQEIVLGQVGETGVVGGGSPAGIVIADSFDLPGGSSSGTGFGNGTGLNQGLATRHTGALAGTLSYVQTVATKAAGAHSIANNKLTIADAAEVTAFQFSANGTAARNFGPEIRGRRYEWRATLELDDTDISAARMSLGIADSTAPSGGVGGHNLCVQLDLVTGNTVSVFKRIAAGANSTNTAINAAIRTGLPAGAPVDVRVILQESTDYTVFGTAYQVYINGTIADTGNIRFRNDSRYIIFDTAGGVGPAQYDSFALETLDSTAQTTGRIPIVGIAEKTPAPVSGLSKVRLHWTTQPGRTFQPMISSDLVNWEPILSGGTPVQVPSGHHTIQWLEVEIPPIYQNNAFIRLGPVP